MGFYGAFMGFYGEPGREPERGEPKPGTGEPERGNQRREETGEREPGAGEGNRGGKREPEERGEPGTGGKRGGTGERNRNRRNRNRGAGGGEPGRGAGEGSARPRSRHALRASMCRRAFLNKLCFKLRAGYKLSWELSWELRAELPSRPDRGGAAADGQRIRAGSLP